jgi:DNA-binding MarR family transcriptional regulator
MDAGPINNGPVDLETGVGEDEHLSLRLWLRLLACRNLIDARIRAELRQRFTTTLPRFDLMAQLERNPAGLPMSELSRRMMVTGGNVTGITDQLEAEGLVQRQLARGDRRSYTVKLTAAGRRQFARMAAEHERWIVEMFGTLGIGEKTQLYDVLGKLKHSLQTSGENEND